MMLFISFDAPSIEMRKLLIGKLEELLRAEEKPRSNLAMLDQARTRATRIPPRGSIAGQVSGSVPSCHKGIAGSDNWSTMPLNI
jgi:hypothetical protein